MAPGFGLAMTMALLCPALAQTPDLEVCGEYKPFSLVSAEPATGVGTITYEWYENDQKMGSYTSSICIAEGRPVGTYAYVRKASSEACPEEAASNTYTVVVLAAPTAPTALSSDIPAICDGTATTMTLTATGGDVSSGVIYEWGTGSTVGSNMLSPSTTTANTYQVSTSAATTYWVRLRGTGACSATVTGGATVSIPNITLAIPEITRVSAGTVCQNSGDNLIFRVTAPVKGATYTWTWSNSAGSSGAGTASGTGDGTYTISSIYWGARSVSVRSNVTVGGATCKSANAATVTTYVSALPSISSHTAATSTCSGRAALLRVTASNATAYQWKKDGQDVTDGTGGTSASYTTGALTVEATYTVVVSNAAGCSVTSSSIPVTVIAPPDITLSGANVQTVEYCEPITTIEYSAANSTFALSGGSLPAGVTGTASEGSFTIAGMPSGAAAGVYNYTVTATSSSVGTYTATASGTITLNETVPAPSGARTARVWCVGTQLWSDAIALAPAGCTAASTNFGTASPPTTAYYRSSGLVTGCGYLYNWKCVDEQATNLCPSPWRVPVSTDFCKLDKALFSRNNCNSRTETASDVVDKYITQWGGVWGGWVYGTQSSTLSGNYWSTSKYAESMSYYLTFGNTGYINPDSSGSQAYGYQGRCVK